MRSRLVPPASAIMRVSNLSAYMGQPLKRDYLWAGFCLLGAIYFTFRT
jgi:uncharacterized protein (DUF486 family)